MRFFVVAGFLLTSASRGPSAIAEPLVGTGTHCTREFRYKLANPYSDSNTETKLKLSIILTGQGFLVTEHAGTVFWHLFSIPYCIACIFFISFWTVI